MKKLLFVVSIIISLILVSPSYCQKIMDCNAYKTYIGKPINVIRLLNPNITNYMNSTSSGNEYLLDQYEDNDKKINLISKTDNEGIIKSISIEINDYKNKILSSPGNVLDDRVSDDVFKNASLELQMLGIDVSTIKDVTEGYNYLHITTTDDVNCTGYIHYDFKSSPAIPIYGLSCTPIAETEKTQVKITNTEYSGYNFNVYFSVENIGKTKAQVNTTLFGSDFKALNKNDERIMITCSLVDRNKLLWLEPGESQPVICSMDAINNPPKIIYENFYQVFIFNLE